MNWLGIYVRGLCMCTADLVPGVSGGTLALITGIYERLIAAIASIDLAAIRLLLRGRIGEAWRHVDGTFLAVLLAGILSAIFALAHLIDYLLMNQAVLIWAFFTGLVFASALSLLAMVRPRSVGGWLALLIGVALALLLGQLREAPLPAEGLVLVLGGFIAISAMMLPGISGSFLLLMLGLYQPTLQAVKSLDVGYLLLFMLGAAAGFAVFSRLIRYLLKHYHNHTLLFLIGLLLGSLQATWPWKADMPAPVWLSMETLLAALCALVAMALVLAMSLVSRPLAEPVAPAQPE